MNDRTDSPAPTRGVLYALLAVLAPALGGSTEPWARGTLLVATGLVLIVAPPRRSPGRAWLALGGALLALALTAFLPVAWFGLPQWRALAAPLALPLGRMITPQPWVSVEAAGQFFAALVFGLALAAHRWEHRERNAAAQLYGFAILALAILALVAVRLTWHVPWWPATGNSPTDFGFFPNRNQTANVFALGGIVIAGLAFGALSRRKLGGYGWCVGLLVVGAALIAAQSRAGVLLFLGGVAVWVLFPLRFSKARKGATLGFAAVLLLFTGFLLSGSEPLQRLQRQFQDGQGDFRITVQRDAWTLAAVQPWIGQGAGNFESVFAMTHASPMRQGRARHPESDWLWTAVEMGWPVVILLLAGLVKWGVETMPYDSGSGRYLRSAAAVGALAFALHGLVDVSGHRLGALWPALFLFSLARHPRHAAKEESAWVAGGFRLGAAAVMTIGAWWLVAAAKPERTKDFPTSSTLAWIESRMDQENERGNYSAAGELATEAIAIAPLSWNFYYQRAVAHAAEPDGIDAATADFDRARFLEPHFAGMCLGEGRVWLALGQYSLALESWTLALQRAGAEAPDYFREMLRAGWKDMRMRAALGALSHADPRFVLDWLGGANGLEFDVEAGKLLERDPRLEAFTTAQRGALFDIWARSGDPEQLIEVVRTHPEWMADAWLGLARYYARQGDYERAWSFAERYGPTPALPQITTGKSLAELERSYHFNAEIHEGLALFNALRALRQNDEALTTLLEVAKMPGRPAYVSYLEAQMRAERREWQLAWEAWQRFFTAPPPG